MTALEALHEFFGASVGAAAALIGLLFVAISIAPEKTFGEGADLLRRVQAERAFTALGNVFFVSLVALLPADAPQAIAVLGLAALMQTMRAGLLLWRSAADRYDWREYGVISFAIYAFEGYLALRVLHGEEIHEGLVWVLIGLYAYALGAAWGLLGARDADKA